MLAFVFPRFPTYTACNVQIMADINPDISIFPSSSFPEGKVVASNKEMCCVAHGSSRLFLLLQNTNEESQVSVDGWMVLVGESRNQDLEG